MRALRRMVSAGRGVSPFAPKASEQEKRRGKATARTTRLMSSSLQPCLKPQAREAHTSSRIRVSAPPTSECRRRVDPQHYTIRTAGIAPLVGYGAFEIKA